MPRLRLDRDEREKRLITTALALAANVGYRNVTREALANAAECSTGLITSYFGTMVKFRRTLMRHAVVQGNLHVLAQGLADKDEHALKAPEEIRHAAAALLGQ